MQSWMCWGPQDSTPTFEESLEGLSIGLYLLILGIITEVVRIHRQIVWEKAQA